MNYPEGIRSCETDCNDLMIYILTKGSFPVLNLVYVKWVLRKGDDVTGVCLSAGDDVAYEFDN